jgi:hypothetical protein
MVVQASWFGGWVAPAPRPGKRTLGLLSAEEISRAGCAASFDRCKGAPVSTVNRVAARAEAPGCPADEQAQDWAVSQNFADWLAAAASSSPPNRTSGREQIARWQAISGRRDHAFPRTIYRGLFIQARA